MQQLSRLVVYQKDMLVEFTSDLYQNDIPETFKELHNDRRLSVPNTFIFVLPRGVQKEREYDVE